MNPRRSRSSSGVTTDEHSVGEEEENRTTPEVQVKNFKYWKTRFLRLLSQMRESCKAEEKQKRRASYESVFGSDFGE